MSAQKPASADRFRRIIALVRKETYQILRDPSTIIIAVVLPLTLLFLFGYGVSFDARRIDVALVIENPTPETGSFAASLTNSPLFAVQSARDRRTFEDDLVAGRIDGIVVLASNFSVQTASGGTAPVQVIVDEAIRTKRFWSATIFREVGATGCCRRRSRAASLRLRRSRWSRASGSTQRFPATITSFRDRLRSS